MSVLMHIRALEKAAGVEPATTQEHYRTTTDADRRDYMKWLSAQAPTTAGFLPTQVFNWMFSIPTPKTSFEGRNGK